ncbi:Got1/Sft2-like family-domain-containing protein [Gaertneriomyces semiglobifer]|nr:Got1/Sft2-like family-domain-containing protein [Gaertneriomyces semiglobifer]
MILAGPQKFGAALTGAGIFFFVVGVMLFLDKGLMAVGNLLFVSGITFLLTPSRTVAFFSRRDRLSSTACFLSGIVLVLIRWPFVGLVLEVFGVFNLFGPFLPTVLGFMKGLLVSMGLNIGRSSVDYMRGR